MAVISNTMGEEIEKALGIKHCRKLVIHMEVSKAVIVEAEFYPEKDDIREAFTIIKRYELKEKEIK